MASTSLGQVKKQVGTPANQDFGEAWSLANCQVIKTRSVRQEDQSCHCTVLLKQCLRLALTERLAHHPGHLGGDEA